MIDPGWLQSVLRSAVHESMQGAVQVFQQQQQQAQHRIVAAFVQAQRALRREESEAEDRAFEERIGDAARTGKVVTLNGSTRAGVIAQSIRRVGPYISVQGILEQIAAGNEDDIFVNPVLRIEYGTASGANTVEVDVGRGSQLTVPADTMGIRAFLDTAIDTATGERASNIAGTYKVGASISCGHTRPARSYCTRSIALYSTDGPINGIIAVPRNAYALNVFASSPDWYFPGNGVVEFLQAQGYGYAENTTDPVDADDDTDNLIALSSTAFENAWEDEGPKIPGPVQAVRIADETGNVERLLAVFALNV